MRPAAFGRPSRFYLSPVRPGENEFMLPASFAWLPIGASRVAASRPMSESRRNAPAYRRRPPRTTSLVSHRDAESTGRHLRRSSWRASRRRSRRGRTGRSAATGGSLPSCDDGPALIMNDRLGSPARGRTSFRSRGGAGMSHAGNGPPISRKREGPEGRRSRPSGTRPKHVANGLFPGVQI